jgi:hypothetical protein
MKKSIVELAPKLWRRTTLLRSGVGIAVAVVACVGLRLLWLQAHQPAHGREIAAAFGSASLFYGVPQMNHDGSQFTYTATSDHGYGLFLCDAATGRKQMIHEEHVLGPWGSYYAFYAWPWAPDDSAFAYSLLDQLVICPADTNQAPAQLAIVRHSVNDLVWLNPAEFAYVTWGTNLCYAQKQEDGGWEQHELLHGSGISSLTAVDTNTIAWLQDGLICRLDLAAGLTGTSNLLDASTSDTNTIPPTDGLKLWLDASTLKQADQTAVSVLRDLSSSGNDAIPNGAPPTYNGPESPRALNGKGTIHFSSADSATGLKTHDKLGVTGNTPRTIFAVMHHDAGRVMQINIGDFGARFGFFGLEEDDRSIYMPRIWNRWANRVIMRSPVWNVVGVIFDRSKQSAYVNGVLKGTNNVYVATVDKEVEIGLRSASANATNAVSADGDFAELMIYNRALDASERQRVENYLKFKWLGNNLLSAKSPLVWCNPEMTGLTSFSYSKETGQFLLTKSENGKNSLWRFDPQAGQPLQIDGAGSIKNIQWIGKSGYAYARLDSGRGSVVLTDASGTQKTSLFERGDVRSFQATPDGEKLLIVGTFSNEPAAGIWQYDLGSRQLSSIVSYSDYPSVHARNMTPLNSVIKLPSGRSVNCTIYQPANFDRHKKYPLLIGYTSLGTVTGGGFGRLGLPAIAACGAYVVVVDRVSWDTGIDLWEENVTGARKSLEKNPNIDFRQVYVFAASKETHYLNECIAKSPGLWKGAILLNPGELPDFSQSSSLQQRPKILISAGGEEHEEDRLKKYQEESLKSGVLVDTVISSGEGHFFVGNAGQLERTRAMMHFIFEE